MSHALCQVCPVRYLICLIFMTIYQARAIITLSLQVMTGRCAEGNNTHANTQPVSARLGFLTQDCLVWVRVPKSHMMVLVH